MAVNIPHGQWHLAEVLESGIIIMDPKDGAYEPQREEDILSL